MCCKSGDETGQQKMSGLTRAMQKTIYDGYRRGEIPWWDPYSFAGRPLLADAHVNGTDWIRVLLYRLLPFEAAYNWTRLAHFLITGLGMLLLLRAFNFELFVSVRLLLEPLDLW